MTKLKTVLAASVALISLAACDSMTGYDCSDKSSVASKQWSKERTEYCNAMKLKEKEHTHKENLVHIHKGGELPHYHDLENVVYGADDGVFNEGDNDYDRESTLNDLSEDDEELIGNVTP